ncbi:MAG TPA: TolC family protein [Chitinophagaceae bacterium]|nr:TolC family protein [Chitinophagaceae bacterium]
MKTFSAIKNILPILSVFLYTQSIAQQVNEFSAKQAVDYALKNSAQVKNALIDIQVQKQTNKEITAAAFPQINGNMYVNHFPNVAVQTFPNFIAAGTYGVLLKEGIKDGNGNPIQMPANFGIIEAQFGSKYTAGAGLDVNQLLFDGQVFVGLQVRKIAIEFSTKLAEVTSEQIKANVYKIYYQLVVGRKQIKSIDDNIERFEKLLHDTREIFKNGFAEKLDVDKVEVQLNNLRTEKLKAENLIEGGYAGLKFLLSMPQKDKLILTDSLSEEELKANILEETYNYADRKEYQQLAILEKLNGYNIRRYKLSKLPTIALSGNYSKSAQRQKFDFFQGNYFTSSFIGLRMSVPIFDGGARNARIEKAKLEFQKIGNNIEQLKLSIDNDVEQARLKMKSALATMESQKRNILLAEQVYRTTKLKYEQGLGSNQEIYNAQTELKVAQNNYYSSLYDAINAKVDYLKAAGKL